MKYLNQRLLDLNREITNELQNINPELKQQYNEKKIKQEQLRLSYDKLLEQNKSLEDDLREYYSIEQEENNQTLFVNQQNIYLKFWILITFIVVFITIKQFFNIKIPSLTNDSVTNSFYSSS
jgi:hypothetical protein